MRESADQKLRFADLARGVESIPGVNMRVALSLPMGDSKDRLSNRLGTRLWKFEIGLRGVHFEGALNKVAMQPIGRRRSFACRKAPQRIIVTDKAT